MVVVVKSSVVLGVRQDVCVERVIGKSFWILIFIYLVIFIDLFIFKKFDLKVESVEVEEEGRFQIIGNFI